MTVVGIGVLDLLRSQSAYERFDKNLINIDSGDLSSLIYGFINFR